MAAPSTSRGRALAFSTIGAPSGRRAELWQAHCRLHIPGYRCSPLGRDDLRITLRRTWIPDVEIVEVAGDSNLMERTEDLIAAVPDRTITIGILTAGRAFVQHNDLIDVLEPGDALVYDPSSPCSYGRSDGFEEIVLVLSRRIFDRRHGDGEFGIPRVLRHEGDAVLTRSRELQEAVHRSPVAPAEVARQVDRVLDALQTDGRPAIHWIVARDHIRRSLHDPRLSVASVAAAAGVSERQLARVFAERGTTVREAIVAERMHRAHDLLTDPARAAMTIAQVAEAVGFVSPSHFARAFRRVHGVPASAARREAHRARA